MNLVVDVLLPLSLAFIMFSLGLGLVPDDFRRVVQQPRAFLVGLVGQMVVLPVMALALAVGLGLPPALAVGLMILAFSPGGVSSNLLTKLARGDMALSISLTAVTSVLSIVTVPLLVTAAMHGFLGAAAPELSVARLGLSVGALVSVPVGLGMSLRALRPAMADRLEGPSGRVANGLFLLMVAGAVGSEWRTLVDHVATLGPAVLLLNSTMLAVGYGSGQAFGLGRARSTTLAIEVGIQNATLGITIGALLAPDAAGVAVYSLPSGVYGLMMYLVSGPAVWWLRRTAVPQEVGTPAVA